MDIPGLSIRVMDRKDIDIAVKWAEQEGWNPGIHDAESFFAADPKGFFLAELNGKPAGCISAVAYDESFGFMGFYIVPKELRNKGIAIKLWEHAIAYMGKRTIGGDGVVHMLGKYEKAGFKTVHHNSRYEGIGRRSAIASGLADLRGIPFEELVSYDRLFFPAQRSNFLKSWIGQEDSLSLADISEGQMTGYGVIRRCCKGYKIAPLFADSPETAQNLFASLSAFGENQPVFLDIPVCNHSAIELVERHGMKKVFETGRIYLGSAPKLPLDKIYGITSFELG